MKKLSLPLLAKTILVKRAILKMTQSQLSQLTGINRSMLSRLESENYMPSIEQLQALGEVLQFNPADMFIDSTELEAKLKELTDGADAMLPVPDHSYKIVIAGTGYVGLSLAVLLAQNNEVTAVDIIPEKVEKLNQFISPIQDEYIEKYLDEAKSGKRSLQLKATMDGAAAYSKADFIVIAAPTNYDPKQNFFDCSAVEAVLKLIKESTKNRKLKPAIIIKSTIPVGYTKHIREQLQMDNILFSPEFLRESKALYDNLYPSRIIVGCDENTKEIARAFASLLQQGAIKKQVDTLFMDRHSVYGHHRSGSHQAVCEHLSGFACFLLQRIGHLCRN